MIDTWPRWRSQSAASEWPPYALGFVGLPGLRYGAQSSGWSHWSLGIWRPGRIVRGDCREIDDGVRGARARDVERRARGRRDAGRVVLPDPHVIEAAERDPEGIPVDVVRDREVLAAADALDGEAVGAGAGEPREVDVPDGGARQVVEEDVGAARLPEGHHADRGRLAGAHVVEVDRVALERGVVAGAAVAEPRVEVGRLVVGRGDVADEVDVHRLGARVVDVEGHGAGGGGGVRRRADRHACRSSPAAWSWAA